MNPDYSAKLRFDAITGYSTLEQYILDGETEDLFTECKISSRTTLDQKQKDKLAMISSAFSNTEGGIIIYGMDTDPVNGFDQMTQIIPIGAIQTFKRSLVNAISSLTSPSITNFDIKIFKKRSSDTKGVAIVLIPPSTRPVQSLSNQTFYLRGGDRCVPAPYSAIERMFSAIEAPDIKVKIKNLKYKHETRIISMDIVAYNYSLSAGKQVKTVMINKNKLNVADISTSSDDWKDISRYNNNKTFIYNLADYLYKDLSFNMGKVSITLKPRKRLAELGFRVYADRMPMHLTSVSLRVGAEGTISQVIDETI